MTLPTNEGLGKGERKQPVDAEVEATKLTATFLNGVAVSLAAVGSFAPIFNAMYAARDAPIETAKLGAVSTICFLLSAAIHWIARAYIKRELRK